MKDFIHVRMAGELEASALLDRLDDALPNFKWRQGDSDMQGPYVSGVNEDSVQMMWWLGEQPIDVTVSFVQATSSVSSNKALMDRLLQDLLPSMGAVVEVMGVD